MNPITPFDSVSHEGVDGVFDPDDVDTLVSVLKPFLASSDEKSDDKEEEPVNKAGEERT